MLHSSFMSETVPVPCAMSMSPYPLLDYSNYNTTINPNIPSASAISGITKISRRGILYTILGIMLTLLVVFGCIVAFNRGSSSSSSSVSSQSVPLVRSVSPSSSSSSELSEDSQVVSPCLACLSCVPPISIWCSLFQCCSSTTSDSGL